MIAVTALSAAVLVGSLLSPAVLVLAPLTFGAVAYLCAVPGPTRHERCLAHIAELERELFPEWFQDEPQVLWAGHPRNVRVLPPGAELLPPPPPPPPPPPSRPLNPAYRS